MKRYLLALIAIFLIVIGAILYDVRTAMATSPYDNIISDYQIETLDMINTNTQSSRNYSLDWYTEGLDALQYLSYLIFPLIKCNPSTLMQWRG